jgi:hypothetical protein
MAGKQTMKRYLLIPFLIGVAFAAGEAHSEDCIETAPSTFECASREPTPQEIAEGGGETTQAEQETSLEPEPDTDETVPVPNVPQSGNVLPQRVQTNLPTTQTTYHHTASGRKKPAVCKRKPRKVGKRGSCKGRKRKR